MKDFDDLWRLSNENLVVDVLKLKKLLAAKNIKAFLEIEWSTNEMQKLWSSHRKRYEDLLESLNETINEINGWLKKILNI